MNADVKEVGLTVPVVFQKNMRENSFSTYRSKNQDEHRTATGKRAIKGCPARTRVRRGSEEAGSEGPGLESRR